MTKKLAANHNGKTFFLKDHPSNAGVTALLKWQFAGKRAKWPRWIENVSYPPPPERVQGADLTCTWLGQSTVLLQTAGLNIITDPLLSMRASPTQLAGPRRVRAPGLTLAQLPPIDIVLVSHNHYDHMDMPALRAIIERFAPQIVAPLGNDRYLRRAHGGARVAEVDWGGHFQHGAARLSLVPAQHWSKRGLSDTNKALWGGFIVETAAGVVYFAGDTGYGDGGIFRDIRRTFGTPRLSLLPIGAYEPRWFMKYQHMNPDDAVRAHLDLESATSLAIHHGTIQLTDEAIDAPVKSLGEALAEQRINPAEFLVADVGETIAIR